MVPSPPAEPPPPLPDGPPPLPVSESASAASIEVITNAKNEVVDAVERVSKMLLDSYIETDEEIGPRVQRFQMLEQQLNTIGGQLMRLQQQGR